MKQNFLARFNIHRITLARIGQESDTVRYGPYYMLLRRPGNGHQ
jgi:hypothetical protein